MAKRDQGRPSWMPYMGVALAIAFNIGSVGYTYGSMSFRLQAAEAGLVKVEKRVEDFRELATDMAVVKNQLIAIGATLTRLETTWGPAGSRGK